MLKTLILFWTLYVRGAILRGKQQHKLHFHLIYENIFLISFRISYDN